MSQSVSHLVSGMTYVDYPQVEADKVRLEKPTASLRRALCSTRLPRPDVGGFDNKSMSIDRILK